MAHIPDDLKAFSHDILGVNKIDNGHEGTPPWLRGRIIEAAKRFHIGQVEIKTG
jgi:hypothetical protein